MLLIDEYRENYRAVKNTAGSGCIVWYAGLGWATGGVFTSVANIIWKQYEIESNRFQYNES